MKKWVEAFARRVDAQGLPVEAVMAYRGDKLAAWRYWAADRPRNIYSHTKSYMSTAVGLAIGDGVLSLDDRPADFFPGAVPDGADAGIADITLRHLLMMASGIDKPLLMSPTRQRGVGAPDYAAHVLSHPLKARPGTKFHYSNGDSYLAGRMVEARVGMTLYDYLGKRLFAPLQISPPQWEYCPLGHTFGASGLHLTIEDMMKLGRLYLMEGIWKGERLLDAAWVREATAAQIDTPLIEGNPWHFAYGYQFWRSPYPQSYRADGMYGQISTVLPQADAVVAIQCAESDRVDEIRAALDEEVLSRL